MPRLASLSRETDDSSQDSPSYRVLALRRHIYQSGDITYESLETASVEASGDRQTALARFKKQLAELYPDLSGWRFVSA